MGVGRFLIERTVMTTSLGFIDMLMMVIVGRGQCKRMSLWERFSYRGLWFSFIVLVLFFLELILGLSLTLTAAVVHDNGWNLEQIPSYDPG